MGALTALLLINRIVHRFGARRVALVAAPMVLIVAPLSALVPTPWLLAPGLLLQGFSGNLLATPMNAQSVEVERTYGRRIISSFHGFFSAGQLVGGGLGIWAASHGIGPSAQLAGSSLVLGGALVYCRGWYPEDTLAEPGTRHRSLRERLSPQLALIAALIGLAALTEGSAVQWSALYTSDALHAGAALGAATFTAFALAMTTSRLLGDRLAQRLGWRSFMRRSAALAAVGLFAALLIGTPAAAIAGFIVLGLGAGTINPSLFRLAGTQPGLTPAEGLSVGVMGQWPAFLLGPLIIGGLAEMVGLRWALLLPVLAAATVAFASRRIKTGTPSRSRTAVPAA